jgi:peptidoglycan/xylan/chitin deacetylase (PgdA/CDA1 family)
MAPIDRRIEAKAAAMLNLTKQITKNAALLGAYSLGFHRLARPLFAGTGVIFTSHRVVEPDEVVLDPSQVVTTRFLAASLDAVLSRGYDVVSIDEVKERLLSPRPGPGFVCFTFDDGYRDNLTRALPIFSRRQAPFSLYVTTGFPDRRLFYWWRALEKVIFAQDLLVVACETGTLRLETRSLKQKRAAYATLCGHLSQARCHDAARALFRRHGIDEESLLEQDTLSWPELERLAAEPLVTLGAHSISHPALGLLDRASALKEMAGSGARLEEKLGLKIAHFAYPFGEDDACGRREFDLARECGYETATTTQICNVFPDHAGHLWSLPRIPLDSRAERLCDLDLHLSGLTSVLRMRLSHPALRGLGA